MADKLIRNYQAIRIRMFRHSHCLMGIVYLAFTGLYVASLTGCEIDCDDSFKPLPIDDICVEGLVATATDDNTPIAKAFVFPDGFNDEVFEANDVPIFYSETNEKGELSNLSLPTSMARHGKLTLSISAAGFHSKNIDIDVPDKPSRDECVPIEVFLEKNDDVSTEDTRNLDPIEVRSYVVETSRKCECVATSTNKQCSTSEGSDVSFSVCTSDEKCTDKECYSTVNTVLGFTEDIYSMFLHDCPVDRIGSRVIQTTVVVPCDDVETENPCSFANIVGTSNRVIAPLKKWTSIAQLLRSSL